MQVCQFNVQLVGGVCLSVPQSLPIAVSLSFYFILFSLRYISASLNGCAIRKMHLYLTKCNRKRPHENLNRNLYFFFSLISLEFCVDCTVGRTKDKRTFSVIQRSEYIRKVIEDVLCNLNCVFVVQF